MWAHPIAQENVERLQKIGYTFIGPDAGWLACRNMGPGRLTEPVTIVDQVVQMLTHQGALPKRV